MNRLHGLPALGLLILFLLNIDNWLLLSGWLPMQPVLWIGPLALITVPYWRNVPSLRESPLLTLQVMMFFFALLGALRQSSADQQLQDVYVQGSALLFTALCLAQFRRSDVYARFERALPWALAISTGLCVYDIIVPGTFSRTLGRGSGFFVNPNLAATMLIAMLVASAVRARDLLSVYRATGIATLGVLTTFSRGGLLTLISVSLWYWFRRSSASSGSKLLGLGVAVSLWFVFVNLISDQFILNQNVASRIEIFRGGGGSAIEDLSSDARIRVIPTALNKARDAPLIGQGMQAANSLPLEVERIGMHELGPHNEFLWMLLTYGILGLVALASYLSRMRRRSAGLLFTFLIVQCMLVDGIFLIREMLVVLAFIEQGRHFRVQTALGRTRLESSPSSSSN